MGIKKAKKEDSFKELFDENYSRLFYAALFILNDEANAHDIVEEYLIDLWENYDPDLTYAKAYLFNGIKRRCLDFIKHENVKNKYAQLYLALHNETNFHTSDDEEDERIAVIQQVMEEMPPRTKFVIEQCYFENKKYDEVAEILGLSRDGIRKNIMKGLTLLRNAFSVNYKKGQVTKSQQESL